MPALLVERAAGQGQEESEGEEAADDAGVARAVWLIQQAGEKAYSRDERQWENWRNEIASRLAALSGEWKARIFRTTCQSSVGSTDVLGLVAEVMAPRDCVAAVLDHPDAIRAERSDGLALALGRIMSGRERADQIEPLLHERALALGVSEEMYQNVVGVLISRIRNQDAGPDSAVGGRLKGRAVERGPEAPAPESSKSLSDLLESTERRAVQRSRRYMLLEALEAELNPRQYGTVLGALTKAAQDCAEDGELEELLSVVRPLRKEAGRDRSDESAWRSMAAGALARSGSEQVVKCIVGGLEGAEVELGRRMVGMLACLGENGMGALLEIAQGEDDEYAEQAVRVLVEKDGAESLYMRMLASKAEPSTLEQVMRWLVEAGEVKMAAPLIVLADHAGEGTRLELVRLIRASEGGELTEVLVALLSDPSSQVRMAAVEALAAMKVREAVPELCNLVRRESEFGEGASLREAAVRALGAIGAEAAVPTLSEVLLGKSLMSLVARPAARVAAAQMLAKLGGARAQEALEQGTKVLSRTVRAACQRALARVWTADR
jgi:HEAT repeat protein